MEHQYKSKSKLIAELEKTKAELEALQATCMPRVQEKGLQCSVH